jgi:hypothetical protein
MGITWGGGGYFTCSIYFYLPSRRLEERGGGVTAPCYWTRNSPTYDKSHHKTDPMNSNIYIFLIIAREFGQFKSSVSIKVLCHKIFNPLRGSVKSGLRIYWFRNCVSIQSAVQDLHSWLSFHIHGLFRKSDLEMNQVVCSADLINHIQYMHRCT